MQVNLYKEDLFALYGRGGAGRGALSASAIQLFYGMLEARYLLKGSGRGGGSRLQNILCCSGRGEVYPIFISCISAFDACQVSVANSLYGKI